MALPEQIAQIKARYQATPIPGFLAWWGDELLSLMPAAWRRRLWPPRERVYAVLDNEHRLHLWRASGDRIAEQEHLTLDLEHDPEFAREQVRQLLAAYEDAPPQTVLCLNSEDVLSRRVTMPAAAESALDQALSFEMDRHTPFANDEVYFDYQIASREREENLLGIDLYVGLRDKVNHDVSAVERFGLGLDRVDFSSGEAALTPSPVGVNLLPPERRVRQGSRRTRFNWLLAAVATALLVFVMAESLYLQEQTIERLEEDIGASQRQARIVRQLRTDLDDALAAAGFLAERKRNAPAILVVLAEVTQLLPKDTWVQRMQVTGTELQLQGLSDGAQRLIELLNSASKLEGTYFKGATTTDQRLNKERFTVAADIVMSQENTREEDDAAATGS